MKTKSSSPKHLLICLALAFAAYAAPLSAAITAWTGASDNNWFNPANWTNGVPTASVDAFINTGKAAIYTAGANARTVTIGANSGDSGGLIVDGTNGGSLTVSVGCGGNTEDPNYIGLGIYVGYSGVGEMSILHGGTVTSGYGYIGLMPGDSTHKPSNGAVTIDGVGSTWTFSGCPDARLFVGGNNTGVNPGGIALLSVTGGGIVTVNNFTYALVSLSVGTSGTVTGNGKILLNGQSYLSRLTQVSGTLAPHGNLEIVGNLNLPSTASTVQTVTPDSQDVIAVTTQPGTPAGLATVGGRLSVTMKGTFSPAVTRYTLLESDGVRDGMFSSISINFPPNQYFTPHITYDTNHVYLDLDFTQ